MGDDAKSAAVLQEAGLLVSGAIKNPRALIRSHCRVMSTDSYLLDRRWLGPTQDMSSLLSQFDKHSSMRHVPHAS